MRGFLLESSHPLSPFLFCCSSDCFAHFWPLYCVVRRFSVSFIWMSFCVHLLYFVLSVGMRHFDEVIVYDISESCIFFQSGLITSHWFCLFLWWRRFSRCFLIICNLITPDLLTSLNVLIQTCRRMSTICRALVFLGSRQDCPFLLPELIFSLKLRS